MPGAVGNTDFRLDELAAQSGAALDGDGAVRIDRVATLENAGDGAIAFLANAKYRAQLTHTRASAVIVSPADAHATALPKLVSPQPYLTYAKVARLLHPGRAPVAGVHATAVVDPSAEISADASIAANAVVGARARIGAGAFIGPGVVVGDDADIGAAAALHANAVVYARCVIGPRTVVHGGAVVGADGFGMADDAGAWVRIPQLGRVVVGADCEIGANTTIDRGAIDDTVIEDDVKLDNLIQVGHNCRIGRHTAIAGCVGIAGSTRIGRNCQIGGAAMIGGHLDIPDGTIVSGGTTIAFTLDAPGVYTSVFPQLPYREWRKVAAQLKRLDDIAQRLRALERAQALPDDSSRA